MEGSMPSEDAFRPEEYKAWHPMRLMARQGDTRYDALVRLAIVLPVAIGVLVNVAKLVASWRMGHVGPTYMGVFAANAVGFAAVAGAALCSRWSKALIMLFVGVCLWVVCASDVMMMITGEGRAWPGVVILADVLLVMRAPRSLAAGTVGFVCIWLLMTEAELAFRFGAIDVPGVMEFTERQSRVCCAKPPCAQHPADSAQSFFIKAGIAAVDFMLTRGFADTMWREQAAMQQAAHVTEQVATSLAWYDLDTASAHLLRNSQTLPRALSAPLMQILDNLRVYKPFLPSALLPARRPHAVDVPNPLLPDAGLAAWIPEAAHCRAALVATGIRHWDALREHNAAAVVQEAYDYYIATLRRVTATYGGYEVKTVRDFTLIAFHAPSDALRFCIEAQKMFAARHYGALALPAGVDREGFDVVSVRMGLDVGHVKLDRNALTGRCEFFGAAVRHASQAGEVGLGGVVTVTTPAYQQLSDEEVLVRDKLIGLPYTPREVPGQPVWFYAVVERGAKARLAFARARCGYAAPPHCPPPPPAPSPSPARVSLHSSHGAGTPESASSRQLAASESAVSLSLSSDSWEGGHLPSHTLRERTTREAATVGVVRFAAPCADGSASWEHQEAALTARLQCLHTFLEDTSGHLSLVLNDLAVVSWGMHGRCEQHENESARCLMHLHCSWGGAFHAGLATGPVACGVLKASAEQTHITPMGPCVNTALMLCAGAAEMQAQALVAWFAEGVQGSDLREYMAPVDTWVVAEGGEALTVYELDLRSAMVAVSGGGDDAGVLTPAAARRRPHGAGLAHRLVVLETRKGEQTGDVSVESLLAADEPPLLLGADTHGAQPHSLESSIDGTSAPL